MAKCALRLLIPVSLFLNGVAWIPEDGRIYTNAPWPSGEEGGLSQHSQSDSARRLASTISDANKKAILDRHNEFRAAVTDPCKAADMEILVWDTNLASKAEEFANKCKFEHDTAANNANGWGENLAASWSSAGNSYDAKSLATMVQSWYDEIVDLDWKASADSVKAKVYADPETQCKQVHGSGCAIGHYTQVIWAKTNKVGCGVAQCTGASLMGQGGVNLVCKYTPAGNMQTGNGLEPPYIVGDSCAACSAGCSGNLCKTGSNITRCADTIFTMTYNGKDHKTCKSLIRAIPKWCSENKAQYEAQFKICQKTCNKCTVPAQIGATGLWCEAANVDGAFATPIPMLRVTLLVAFLLQLLTN